MSDIVGRRDLASRIAEQTGVSAEAAEKVLRDLGPAIARHLAEGVEVRLPRLARFFVREKETQGGGEGEDAWAERADIVAQVSTLFRSEVLGPAIPRFLVLAAEGEAGTALHALEKLRDEGRCMLARGKSLEEIDAFRKTRDFDVLLLGEGVTAAEYRYLTHEIKLHPDNARISIVMMSPEGKDPYAVDTLTLIPDEVIETPADPGVVEGTLRELIDGIAAGGDEYLQQMAIRAPSSGGMCETVMEVVDRLGAMTPLGDRRQAEFMPAIREAVENAVRIGNAEDPSKFVDLTFLVDDEKVSVVIKDEGPEVSSRGESSESLEETALASMIMKKGADEVEILPPGNRVMLTKYY